MGYGIFTAGKCLGVFDSRAAATAYLHREYANSHVEQVSVGPTDVYFVDRVEFAIKKAGIPARPHAPTGASIPARFFGATSRPGRRSLASLRA